MSREINETYSRIRLLILREFSDIAELTERVYGKLRVHLTDGSYLTSGFHRKYQGASPITGNTDT